MFRTRNFYLIKIQYLGFRYHGWQKQPGQPTVQHMVGRTLKYILGDRPLKVLAAGRTDAKVSVNATYIELFLDGDPLDLDTFLDVFNLNLPSDIKVLKVTITDANFNIIQHPKIKEYVYLFSFGQKNHPFTAPFMLGFLSHLDIPLMQSAALLMQGKHDFKNFTFRPKPETKTQVVLDCCEIVPNTLYTASFFPDESYLLRVKGAGFKRHQVRLMMGALLDVGSGKMTLEAFKKALAAEKDIKLEHIAPASGLILQDVVLK